MQESGEKASSALPASSRRMSLRHLFL